jgi:hypothetical protein
MKKEAETKSGDNEESNGGNKKLRQWRKIINKENTERLKKDKSMNGILIDW